jgi:hypothetical protein
MSYKRNETVFSTMEEINQACSQLDSAKKVPLKVDDGGVIKDVTNMVGVYNLKQGKLCSAVTPSYNLLQHKDYFVMFADAMNRLNLKFNMEVQNCGNKAICDITFIDKNIEFKDLNEEFATGMRLVNSYNKTTGISIMPRFTRLACTNGMIVSRFGKVETIKHHYNLAKNIDRLVEVKLNEFINSDNLLRKWVSESMADSIEWTATTKIIERIFKIEKFIDLILKPLGISVDVVEIDDNGNKKKSFIYRQTGESIVENRRIDRWTLYNAITSAISHSEHISPNIEMAMQKKAEKVLTTRLENLQTVHI